jgi:hypothetical protein
LKFGVQKVVVKLPYEEWRMLQRFRGGSDSDRICRIIEMANQNLTEAVKARAEQKAEAEKPSLIHRVFGK